MGTRAITKVYDNDGDMLISLYRQFDGYQDCHGKELKDFLLKGSLVNGFQSKNQPDFNGMGCLAAQLISNFKKCIGNFYVQSDKFEDDIVDYIYEIGQEGNELTLKVTEYDSVVYNGLVREYPAKDDDD